MKNDVFLKWGPYFGNKEISLTGAVSFRNAFWSGTHVQHFDVANSEVEIL
jgi:hypothetical protein